jgi:hypothetical protein
MSQDMDTFETKSKNKEKIVTVWEKTVINENGHTFIIAYPTKTKL